MAGRRERIHVVVRRCLCTSTAAMGSRRNFSGNLSQCDVGRAVCFASAAPGEVFVGDNKLVGISQRRNREGARFQCVLYRQWNPLIWSSLLTSVDVQEHVCNMQVATIAAPARDIADAVMAALAALTPA